MVCSINIKTYNLWYYIKILCERENCMTKKVEQITPELNIVVEEDQVLTGKQISAVIIQALGEEYCTKDKLFNKNIIKFRKNNREEILVFDAISYLGHPHPLFKKRVQFKESYKKIYDYYLEFNNVKVHFIGVYHFNGLIIFADFLPDTYVNRGKFNNCSAHVYTNDLFQAIKLGYFEKEDQMGNRINLIAFRNFYSYLIGNLNVEENAVTSLFKKFNNEFVFGTWLKSMDAIQQLFDVNSNNWRQGEWPGWYLEYKFDDFIQKYEFQDTAIYTGNLYKKTGDTSDFDIWFPKESFFGDLKASDIDKPEAPGNDQENFLSVLNRDGKFWYIIYEHETLKDRDMNGENLVQWKKDIKNNPEQDFEATLFRTNLINENTKKQKDELSYSNRMKHSVRFKAMFILEINRVNFREILSDFNQGKQPSGEARAKKFKISKRNIDNFIVFKYNFSSQ